jgi:hypothetical protein
MLIFWRLLADANKIIMTNTYCLYKVLRYSWLWTVNLSETCRVPYQINLGKVHLVGFHYTNHGDIYIFQVFEQTVTNQNCFHESVEKFAKRNQFTIFSRPISNFRKRDRNVANISFLFLSGCETCTLTFRDEHRLKVSTNSLQQSSSVWGKQVCSQTCTAYNKNLQNINTY